MVSLVALKARWNLGAFPRNMSMLETMHTKPLLAQLYHFLVRLQGSENVALLRFVEAVAHQASRHGLGQSRGVGDLVGEIRRLLSLTLVGVCRLCRGFDGGDAGGRGVGGRTRPLENCCPFGDLVDELLKPKDTSFFLRFHLLLDEDMRHMS